MYMFGIPHVGSQLASTGPKWGDNIKMRDRELDCEK
jgi:hypothetical protein